MPEQLNSDQSKQFESKLLNEVCTILRIDKKRTTYHPQSDGLMEHFNRTLLLCYPQALVIACSIG